MEQAVAIAALTNTGTKTYSISDSATAIATQLGTDATVIGNATNTATNDAEALDLSVEQAGALTGAGVTITNGYNLSDTAALIAAECERYISPIIVDGTVTARSVPS